MFSKKAIDFFLNLELPQNLPDDVSVMSPFDSEGTVSLVKKFFRKYFHDSQKRTFLVGINPGRFGGGKTGIAFTDPINLEQKCRIKNDLEKKAELSSKFVYQLIDEFGGAEKFYSSFFISALYPLALIKNGKNFNYYDSQKVYKALKPQILSTFKEQIDFGANEEVVISFGKKNALYLKEINDDLKFFKKIMIFDHPRFVMQYRLKKLGSYLTEYNNVLKRISK